MISKNIISLEKDGDTALLIKKTDNLKKLPKQTQKLINTLFPGAETTLSANNQSLLKIERTYKLLRRQTMRKFSSYKIKLNSLYILSSIAMIFCGIIVASLVAVNPLHTFLVITVCALLMVPFVYLFTIRFKRKIITILIRLLSAFCLFGIASWMSIYTSILYSFIILLSIILIFFYSKAFSKRSGLLRNKIKETEEYKSYLQKNPELAINAKDFSTRLPYIYAFELENKYADISTLALLEQFAKLVSTHPIKE